MEMKSLKVLSHPLSSKLSWSSLNCFVLFERMPSLTKIGIQSLGILLHILDQPAFLKSNLVPGTKPGNHADLSKLEFGLPLEESGCILPWVEL